MIMTYRINVLMIRMEQQSEYLVQIVLALEDMACHDAEDMACHDVEDSDADAHRHIYAVRRSCPSY